MAEVNLRKLPSGVRFCPEDIELIRYLERKNHGYSDFIPVHVISQFKPDQLPQSNCSTRGKKGELYFYVERDPNKSRQKRSVGKEFFWRTANSSMITDKGTVVGQKTRLEFHTRRGQKSTKPEWMMQEYSLIAAASPVGSSSLTKDMKTKKVGKFVLCKVYKKKTTEVETEEVVSFDSIEDESVDEDGNHRNPSWSYIHEHADDENILRQLQG